MDCRSGLVFLAGIAVMAGVSLLDCSYGGTSSAAEETYSGIDDLQAVAVLKEEFGHGVKPSEGRMLYDLILKNGYKRALDIGTAEGYSSTWIATAIKKTGGKLITIEIDPEVAAKARENFKRAGVAGVTDLRINDALKEIPALEGDFDFVFMDTGVEGMNKKLLDLLYRRILPGGAMTAHNADAFSRHEPEFLKAITTDPALETKMVATVRGAISVTIKKGR